MYKQTKSVKAEFASYSLDYILNVISIPWVYLSLADKLSHKNDRKVQH